MSKKTEHEVLFRSTFYIKFDEKNGREAELRLRRFGTRFIVDKSCFNGASCCHFNYYDDIEHAYADYKSFLEANRHILEEEFT